LFAQVRGPRDDWVLLAQRRLQPRGGVESPAGQVGDEVLERQLAEAPRLLHAGFARRGDVALEVRAEPAHGIQQRLATVESRHACPCFAHRASLLPPAPPHMPCPVLQAGISSRNRSAARFWSSKLSICQTAI